LRTPLARQATGKPYVDIRKQWDRLIAIASEMLGYPLVNEKADFFTFRHTGASNIAQTARRAACAVRVRCHQLAARRTACRCRAPR
jgi:hypothetical protein